nr:MAG TPA: hypothetical protein [Caudoviricetes sp.]
MIISCCRSGFGREAAKRARTSSSATRGGRSREI